MTDKNRVMPARKIEALKKALLPISESVPGLTRKTAKELAGPCPWCGGEDRFVVFKDSGRYLCRECSPKGGDVIDFHRRMEGLDIGGLTQKHLGQHPEASTSNVTGRYEYLDPAGKLLYWKEKIEPGRNGRDKEFFFSHGNHEKGRGCEPVLYNLPDVLKASSVIITEGEKHADTLKSWGLTATTLDSGAQSKLKPEMIEQLSGKSIVILRDNDEPGLAYAETLAKALHGKCESLKVVLLPGLPEKGDILDWIEQSGNDKAKFQEIIESAPEMATSGSRDPWQNAGSLFPKQAFPWHVLPNNIATSLQQLARSCATSPVALPGAAFALLASVIGSTVSVLPKSSWCEPIIFWMADIRPSGDGKTPAARALCKPLYDAQKKADAEYQTAYEQWRSKPSVDREVEPKRARGYFITDLTLEGLRDDITGHGGTVAVLDEISSFLSAQNQYKSKGSDRESWLSLHDGHPFRVVRSGKTYTVAGARVSIFGGVQPEVWHKIFGGDGGLYLSDGTVFRFLPTYEGSQFYELTSETWSEKNQTAWENTLKKAMKWADSRISSSNWEPLRLSLDDEARQYFLDWRNELYGFKPELPKILQGFIPKIVGYALRLAGILHCMDRFSQEKDPAETLTLEDIKNGVETARFYLGHIVYAAEALCSNKTGSEIEITEQVLHLARTLKALQPDLDSGRLAVGYIHERFNQDCMPEIKFSNPRAMGSFLRSQGLTIPDGYFSAKGKRSVKTLLWDAAVESFLEQVCNGRDVCKISIDGDSQAQSSDDRCPRCLQGEDSHADISDGANMTSASGEPHQADACRHIDHSDHCSEQNEKQEGVESIREGNRVVFE